MFLHRKGLIVGWPIHWSVGCGQGRRGQEEPSLLITWLAYVPVTIAILALKGGRLICGISRGGGVRQPHPIGRKQQHFTAHWPAQRELCLPEAELHPRS